MQPFSRLTIEIIRAIPEGKVMTYGQIAASAGSPRGARQVVRILHSMSQKHQLPWHRVVNAKGEIAIQDEESSFLQKLLLENEGIELSADGRVDLSIYRHEVSCEP
ncbi:MGMT family protein [Paenibacillus eucommiae]|uniref:Methylated-DNA-protein-cysteine methyltransferase-like protein n=1 Tax=Paenibacillus eucommiae TaxID=1355755 RepID=A0ABS4J2P3_9BACL|nr:MGMT family protein [Paenibacillus eucommiae]MBP1994097.1 methylated-DNA-protein-cysteine methyltransferase-like protein [Paenibacillus eucommiae]